MLQSTWPTRDVIYELKKLENTDPGIQRKRVMATTMMIKLTLVLQLCIVLLFALVGCASRTHSMIMGKQPLYHARGAAGLARFNSIAPAKQQTTSMSGCRLEKYCRSDITTEDVGGYRLDGGDGRVECVTGTFRFYFVDGKLDFAGMEELTRIVNSVFLAQKLAPSLLFRCQ